MRVAVLSLTRDRLDYTQHCFGSLRENAGCDYDHYVLDQASEDGTAEWLAAGDYRLEVSPENVGICRGLNRLLRTVNPDAYDVIVRFDNDCEVTVPGTLRAVCEVAVEYEAIVAPHVLCLNHPPEIVGRALAGEHTISETLILGGIFMAVPAFLFTEHRFRYDERMPPWTGDEAIVPWWRAHGGTCGYLDGWTVNHYERVVEQADALPGYQERKLREMGMVAA